MRPFRLGVISNILSISPILLLLTSLSLPMVMADSLKMPEPQVSNELDFSDKAEVYGPENLLRTMRTPFTTGALGGSADSQQLNSASALKPIAISSNINNKRSSLFDRFRGPKLFLPPRLVLGQSAEFIVKGNPGAYVAIAMADKNSGAKPVYGHSLRLGPDRKLVGLSKIPDTGIASMFVEMPIEGDLVGQPVYFEAAVWSEPDFSDLQIASAVSPQNEGNADNSVIVCGQEGKKPGVLVLDVSKPMSLTNIGSLSSGKP